MKSKVFFVCCSTLLALLIMGVLLFMVTPFFSGHTKVESMDFVKLTNKLNFSIQGLDKHEVTHYLETQSGNSALIQMSLNNSESLNLQLTQLKTDSKNEVDALIETQLRRLSAENVEAPVAYQAFVSQNSRCTSPKKVNLVSYNGKSIYQALANSRKAIDMCNSKDSQYKVEIVYVVSRDWLIQLSYYFPKDTNGLFLKKIIDANKELVL